MESTKKLDRIYEAYYGTSPAFNSTVYKERIDWICSQAVGTTVLDIGCSQGITCMLLAREGKKAKGIDTEQASIDFAVDALSKENPATRSNASFECISLFDYSNDTLYDTVVMGEILEHLYDPVAAIGAAAAFLAPHGRLLCTVPFGVDDFPDHKRTYYHNDIIRQLESHFEVLDVIHINRWLGLICRKRDEKSVNIDFNQNIKAFESHHYANERRYINSAARLRRDAQDKDARLVKDRERNTALLSEIEQRDINIARLEASVSDANRLREAAVAELERCTFTQKLELSENRAALLSVRAECGEALRDMRSELDAMTMKLAEKDTSILRTEKAFALMLEEVRGSINDVRNQVSVHVDTIVQQKSQISSLEDQLVASQSAYEQQTVQIGERDAALLAIKERLSKKEAELLQTERAFALMLGEVRGSVDDMRGQVSVHVETIAQQKNRISSLEAQLCASQSAYEQQTVQIGERDAAMLTIKAQLSKRDAEKRTMERSFAVMLKELRDAVEGQTKGHEHERIAHKEALATLREERDWQIDNYNRTLDSIKYKIGERVVWTIKNPLKLFLWPVWAWKALYKWTHRASSNTIGA